LNHIITHAARKTGFQSADCTKSDALLVGGMAHGRLETEVRRGVNSKDTARNGQKMGVLKDKNEDKVDLY
jgi:hypothetical protein